MDIETLQKTVVDALEDIKARDIEIIDTAKLTSMFERMVIASADSTRQTRALAN
ncbi:MAG: ribosome silencing factor, partial [Pseudomonadota bacterium]